MSFINNPQEEAHGMKRAHERPVDRIFPGNARLIALASGTCAMANEAWNNICKGNGTASEFKDGLSRREYELSGMCQACQDDVFKSDVMEDYEEEGEAAGYKCSDCGETVYGDWEDHRKDCSADAR